MKTLKKVLMSLSVFIAVVFVLSLFVQPAGNPFKEIWEKLDDHDTRITDLEEAVLTLQTQLADANDDITDLQGRMDDVEYELSILPSFSSPDYDSGWFDFDEITIPDATVTHRFDHLLGGDPNNYVVDIQAKSIGGNPHNVNYGSDWVYDPWVSGDLKFKHVGVYWSDLTNEHILVTRTLMDYTDDMPADYVRVRIWVYE